MKLGISLGFIFFGTLFLFASELPNLQLILNGKMFFLILGMMAALIVYLIRHKLLHFTDVREKIVAVLFVALILFLNFLTIGSFVNRSIKPSRVSMVPVNEISYEWNGMYGMSASEKSAIKPSHVRLSFVHKNKLYDKAFKKENLSLEEKDSEALEISIARGALGWYYVQ